MASATPQARKAKKRTARAAAAPKRARADKLSISLPVDDVRWLSHRARRLGTSVSAVISNALAEQRRAEARAELLEMLGDGDITDAYVRAARREAFGE